MKDVSKDLLRVVALGVVSSALLVVSSCAKTATPPAAPTATTEAAPAAPSESPDGVTDSASGMSLPLSFGRRTGDLDEMARSRNTSHSSRSTPGNMTSTT